VRGAPPQQPATEAPGRCESRLSSAEVMSCVEPCCFCIGGAIVEPNTPTRFVRELQSTSVLERNRSPSTGRPNVPTARIRSSGSGASSARLLKRGISSKSSTSNLGQERSSRRTATSPKALQPRSASFRRLAPWPLGRHCRERASANRVVLPAVSSTKPLRSTTVRAACLSTSSQTRVAVSPTPCDCEPNRKVPSHSSLNSENCLQVSTSVLRTCLEGSSSKSMSNTCVGKQHREGSSSPVASATASVLALPSAATAIAESGPKHCRFGCAWLAGCTLAAE